MMSFGSLFSFDGRIHRQQYWFTVLGLTGALVLALMTLGLIGRFLFGESDGADFFLGLWSVVIIPAFIWVSLANNIKRLHDSNRSGFQVLFGLIPLFGDIYLLVVLGFLDGTQGPNRFGPSPKGIIAPEGAAIFS